MDPERNKAQLCLVTPRRTYCHVRSRGNARRAKPVASHNNKAAICSVVTKNTLVPARSAERARQNCFSGRALPGSTAAAQALPGPRAYQLAEGAITGFARS